MEDIINIPSFLSYLTHFLKLIIYLNDDSDKKQIMIETYNKFRRLELEKNYEDDSIKKCLKRINLALKMNDDKPVNIADKNNQRIIFELQPFPALVSGNLDEAVEYSEQFNINVLTDISLKLILSKKNELVWSYLRCLFYFSQYRLAIRDQEEHNMIIEESCDQLVIIMENIDKVADKEKGSGMFASIDKLLTGKLSDQKIDKDTLQDSKAEMMKLLNAGDGQNKTFGKIFDKIGSKIDQLDFSNGNILQNIMELARGVADDMSQDIKSNPDDFSNDAQGLQNILSGFMSGENSAIPPEMSSLIGGLTNMASGQNDNINPDELITGLTSKLSELCDNDDGKEFINEITGQMNN